MNTRCGIPPPPSPSRFAPWPTPWSGWNQPHSVSRLAAHLNQLLIGILDALTEQQAHEDAELTSRWRAVEIFLKDLEEGRVGLGESWTLDRMAAHCGLGVTVFSKYCRELVNASPVEFLNRCRLDYAARQLRSAPRLPVTEIAFASGFNSSQYFATSFAKRFQLSPSDYRKGPRLGR